MGVIGNFIDGFISGWNEADNDNSVQVSKKTKSESLAVSTPSSPLVIASFEEMSKWLTGLQRGASPAVRQAISAQIQVIRFVQSPTLVDTTFDTLMYSLDKSIAVAKNEKEEAELKEAFILMIQNYVFFMDAKLQMSVNQNKEEGRKLFNDAGEMLSNSVKDLALLAVSGGDWTDIAATTVKNIFAPENEKGNHGLLKRIINFIYEEQIIYDKQKEFYDTLGKIIITLGNHQELIGESQLLSGTIKRYLPEMEAFYIADIPEKPQLEEKIGTLQKDKNITCIVIGVISLLWALLRAFYYWLVSRRVSAPDSWFLYQVLWTGAIIGICYLIFFAAIKKKEGELSRLINVVKDKIKSFSLIGNKFEVKRRAAKENTEAFLLAGQTQAANVPASDEIAKKDREYMDMFKEYVSDGDISERDRKMLDKLRASLGISEDRARELEASCSEPQLNEKEREYLEIYQEYAADEKISERDRKMLETIRDKMGISEERAKELESL